MEKQITAKKNQAIPIFLVIIIVFLIIAVLLQNRHINRLENELSIYAVAEKEQSGSNAEINRTGSDSDNISPEKNRSTETDNDCQDRINKLESRIADMQEWQDYLEATMKKEESAKIEVDDKFRERQKLSISSFFKSFLEENNLSTNKKSEFIDLIIERQLELKNANSKIADQEEFQKERENIEADYDIQLSNLLSEDQYTAYQEYGETGQDRNFIGTINSRILSGDNQLNKQQVKDLVAGFYKIRQAVEDSMGIREIKSKGNSRSKEDRLKKLEADKKTLNEYSEAAKEIMTDSQMKEFNEYINLQKSAMKMEENRLSQMPENTD